VTARRIAFAAVVLGAVGGLAVAGYRGIVSGRVSVDLGVGRRVRPLGPLAVDIAAPREVAYAMAAAPYAQRRPKAMAEKVEILDRGEGMVLAAHRTVLSGGRTAVTVETVTFAPPERIGFRLVRGPVPYVAETFEFTEIPGGSRLTYTGELGTDLGRLGQAWGNAVARVWVDTVRHSLETIKTESERRAR
jgi:hypothetical protein